MIMSCIFGGSWAGDPGIDDNNHYPYTRHLGKLLAMMVGRRSTFLNLLASVIV